MVLGLLVFALLVVSHVVAWFVGIILTLWNIQDKHPHAYAEIVAERKRGGKDALSQ